MTVVSYPTIATGFPVEAMTRASRNPSPGAVL
jgi:hypothetical protein